LFETPSKGLGVIWLDARAYDLEQTDDLALRYAAFDANWTQTADEPIDGRVCECCPTSAVATADGVLAAYRDRSDREVRDIYTSRLENGKWTKGTPVHDDGWEIDGCPVNGPALSARGQQAVIAWFTSKNGGGQSYVAFSPDAGRTWGQPIRLDDVQSSGHVGVVLLDDGTAVGSWIESADKRAQLRIRRLDQSGARSLAATISDVQAGVATAYPRVAKFGNEIVIAWTERSPQKGETNGAAQVRIARVSIQR
jgi:hypothetical protein